MFNTENHGADTYYTIKVRGVQYTVSKWFNEVQVRSQRNPNTAGTVRHFDTLSEAEAGIKALKGLCAYVDTLEHEADSASPSVPVNTAARVADLVKGVSVADQVAAIESAIDRIHNDPESRIGAVPPMLFNKNTLTKLDNLSWQIYHLTKCPIGYTAHVPAVYALKLH